MRKVNFICFVLIALLSVVFTACPESESSESGVNEVKIGFIWPLTGGSSTIGMQHNDGARMAIEEINANGGIKSMGGAMIVPVVADSETKPDVGSQQAERLILEEDVLCVIGAYNSAVSFPASDVAQRYQTPWIGMGSVKDEITERDYEWVFRINNKATYDVMEMIRASELFEEELGHEILTVGNIYEATDWGADTAAIIREAAAERGWEVVVDESVSPNQTDLNPQVLKINAANPDILFVSFYTPDQIVFQRSYVANESHSRFGLFSVGGGSQDPAFFEAVSPESYEYMFVQEDWDAGGPERVEWIGEMAQKVQAENGYQLNSFFAQGWTSAYVTYLALEAAGSADKAALRDAMENLVVPADSRALMTGYSGVDFDADRQNTLSHGSIVQYQNGRPIVLWPAENRAEGDNPILPIPEWSER